MQIMSPRRLDAIRSNGNSIVNPKIATLNNQDAASSYKRAGEGMVSPKRDAASKASRMSQIRTEMRAVKNPEAMLDQRLYDAMDEEIEMNANLHLVPCRWERSGWRYVQKDPQAHGFFNNPNRVNSFGVDSGKRRFASSQRRDSFYATGNKSAFGAPKNNPSETTYGRTFLHKR